VAPVDRGGFPTISGVGQRWLMVGSALRVAETAARGFFPSVRATGCRGFQWDDDQKEKTKGEVEAIFPMIVLFDYSQVHSQREGFLFLITQPASALPGSPILSASSPASRTLSPLHLHGCVLDLDPP